jgi:Rrf2 family transcriptional regulator, iron-sulfur cluster assembly transcription factor
MFTLYSRSEKYAIIALAYLANVNTSEYQKVKNVAESCKIPIQYLSKLVHGLQQSNLVTTYRGPTGGIKLSKDPSEIKLIDIVNSITDKQNESIFCLMGKGRCKDRDDCVLHDIWLGIRNEIHNKIELKTLSQIMDIIPIKYKLNNL